MYSLQMWYGKRSGPDTLSERKTVKKDKTTKPPVNKKVKRQINTSKSTSQIDIRSYFSKIPLSPTSSTVTETSSEPCQMSHISTSLSSLCTSITEKESQTTTPSPKHCTNPTKTFVSTPTQDLSQTNPNGKDSKTLTEHMVENTSDPPYSPETREGWLKNKCYQKANKTYYVTEWGVMCDTVNGSKCYSSYPFKSEVWTLPHYFRMAYLDSEKKRKTLKKIPHKEKSPQKNRVSRGFSRKISRVYMGKAPVMGENGYRPANAVEFNSEWIDTDEDLDAEHISNLHCSTDSEYDFF